MKKFISVLLIFIMLSALASCGGVIGRGGKLAGKYYPNGDAGSVTYYEFKGSKVTLVSGASGVDINYKYEIKEDKLVLIYDKVKIPFDFTLSEDKKEFSDESGVKYIKK